ncbi:MAG: copper chaperone PCu(A)C [Gammaproteobacteria bacterium]|nr:copper chaperone PCu(A)C [Gammaproteobacteria bacterium]
MLASLGIVATIAFTQSAHAIEVSGAWIREAPPSARMIGGFMVIRNNSKQDVFLVRAQSKRVEHIEIHRTVHEEGMARMVRQNEVKIPANTSVTFKPGDYHLMMAAPKPPLKAGDKVNITLEFNEGEKVDVVYTVKKMKMMNHDEMPHHHH